ncbi:hypothetical protein A0H81_04896 [Grifola frondosa]|uniref:Uncharacterized protein n=1 Tax=Grifola frondosa TaxID=5627 RepID=A0A1C7MH77_GRIFR|nr:hypothetical protein A0H81_04896 [Grifola frondosa]
MYIHLYKRFFGLKVVLTSRPWTTFEVPTERPSPCNRTVLQCSIRKKPECRTPFLFDMYGRLSYSALYAVLRVIVPRSDLL